MAQNRWWLLNGDQAGEQTRVRQRGAPARAGPGSSLPAFRQLFGSWGGAWPVATILDGRPSWRFLIGLGRRLGANLSSYLIFICRCTYNWESVVTNQIRNCNGAILGIKTKGKTKLNFKQRRE